MRRQILGTAIAAVFAVGCSNIPDGAIAAQALVCPPGQPGCEEILPVGPGGRVTVDMGNFFFTFTDGAAVTGEVVVEAVNVSDAYHNFEVLGAADGSEIVEADGMQTGIGSVFLFPGEWTVICNVPGHRAAGMETTVTVYATQEEADAAIANGTTDVDRDAQAMAN